VVPIASVLWTITSSTNVPARQLDAFCGRKNRQSQKAFGWGRRLGCARNFTVRQQLWRESDNTIIFAIGFCRRLAYVVRDGYRPAKSDTRHEFRSAE